MCGEWEENDIHIAVGRTQSPTVPSRILLALPRESLRVL